MTSEVHSGGNARLRLWRSCRRFVRACDSLDAGHSRKASRSRGCGVSPCRIKYAIRDWRRFVLTAVTGRPSKLIRRLPNKLIRMTAAYVVYDVLPDACDTTGNSRSTTPPKVQGRPSV